MGIEVGTLAAYAAIASAAVGAAGAYMSYSASQDQAKQSKMNAKAQADALGMEQQRQAAETEQAQRRKIMEQRRFTAGQEAALADTGFLSTTGSPLDIMADTYTAQQRELKDMTYQNDTTNWQLGSKSQASIYEGNSQANAIRGQAGGTLLSNAAGVAGSAYGVYGNRGTQRTSTK
jgi:hypothetical protein